MSALPPKADIRGVVAECLLLTQSGHSGVHGLAQASTKNQWLRYSPCLSLFVAKWYPPPNRAILWQHRAVWGEANITGEVIRVGGGR